MLRLRRASHAFFGKEFHFISMIMIIDHLMHCKHALISTPILIPPNYHEDFILYLTTLESTIGMVLVQKDKNLQEHVIYSIRKDLVDGEISYVHVKKLALATIRATQQLQHYIIL